MADLTPQRGAIPVDLDRPRVLFYDMEATGALIARYGRRFVTELYKTTGSSENGDLELQLVSVEALAFFLFAGLQADANQQQSPVTLAQAQGFLHPWTVDDLFLRVVYAVVGNHATPAMLGDASGKAPADSAAAKPPAVPAKAAKQVPPAPGPTKVSTSTKRSVSRSRSSAGRRRSSGR